MFEGTHFREHVFERRSDLKGAARTSPAKAGREAKYTEFFNLIKVKSLDPGWPLAGQTFKICVRAGVRLCSALCSKMSAVLEGQRCWSICEYLGPESEY